MNHQSGKHFPQKHTLLKKSNDNRINSSCHSESAANNFKTICCSSMKNDAGLHCNSSQKVKRLKSRKERNQTRGQDRHMSQHSRREVGEKTQCHRIHPMSSSRKERTIAKPFITQKPSIITEKRLISTRGLFSHEIRSIDIERLVSEEIKKEQRKKTMMHITSPLPPSVPDSDQDCIGNEVQDPENNKPPQVKRKSSRKQKTPKRNTRGFQTNKQVATPKASFRVDGKLDRNAKNTKKEDTNSKTEQNGQCSPRETEHVVLSTSENEPIHQLCFTSDEANKNNSDMPQTDIFKSNDEEKQNQRRFEETSTMVEFPNMEHSQMSENQRTVASVSEPNYGPSQPTDNVKLQKQMSVSCRAAVKRLATRLCQASDLYVPRHRRPLLTECREALMQTLQKRHSFQLEHNLHRLHSLLNGKQTASQLSSGHRHEDCSPFNIALENEDRCHIRNMEIWTDGGMHQDYLSEEVKHNLDRGASTKIRRIQTASSPPFFFKEPLHSHTDMFDEWRKATLSQDCVTAQLHLNQDQSFTQHAIPVFRAPALVDHPVNPYTQLNRGESLNVLSDFSSISQLWRRDPDINLNSYHINHSRTGKTYEASFGGSSFWSHQQQVQEEKENWAPYSFSASYPSEGFQYEPFFRRPRPSNNQHRSDCFGMSLCPRSSSPFYPPIFQE